ncbi:hypothetical protein BBF96_07680 [Anoxybacter fermentans]|uniref:Ribosomal processing cysteine protease Prp n=1 Tax=Anoxybacter fermentans TaxID=1323375 RepID=A0A3S9SY47_9FIRM|nr:ribosomal-processing cysteine protease Prp [Anoxybacter fermentans]AZR73276.1 hypothetical protein BBF96_07680 [Anoxybacter fermentans]
MVRVQIKRNQKGQIFVFNASGHAEAGEYGSDIVCAAISAVMQTALLGLGEYLNLKKRLTYQIDEDGWLYCELPPDLTDEERVRTDAIIETMVIGLKSIQSEYPNSIRVEEEVE